MAWKLNDEPGISINALGEIAKAVVPVLILADAVHWSDKLTAAIMFLIGVVVTSLTTLFVRSATVPTTTANDQISIALNADPKTTTVQDVIAQTQAAKEQG